MMRIFYLSLQILSLVVFISAQSSRSSAIHNTNNWREWNYYQILGLAPGDYYSGISNIGKKGRRNFPNRRTRTKQRSKITKKEVKKAYRKQAQLWHPDKISARKNNAKEVGSTDEESVTGAMNVKECNERFAKIAEAYEVLNDDRKRIEYDLFLLDDEDEMLQQQKSQQQKQKRHDDHGYHTYESSPASPHSSFHEEYTQNFNPRSIFEDFFFGSGHDDDQSNEKYSMNDLYESLFGDDFVGSKNNDYSKSNYAHSKTDLHSTFYYENQQPDRVSEATQIRYDPTIEKEVLRVLHREEYDDLQNQRVYYRIMGQEFVIQEYYGLGGIYNEYVSINDPYFVEDGYDPLNQYPHNHSYQQQPRQHYGEYGSNYDHQQYQHGHKQKEQNQKQRRKAKHLTTSKMKSNEYLSPKQTHEAHFISDNGMYYAELNHNCEFVIMQSNENKYEDDLLIWSSETYLPVQHLQHSCFFAVYGGRIAIVVGDVDQPMSLLWNSPLPSIVPGNMNMGAHSEEMIDYYVSLDDDGSLAVYRTRKIPSSNHTQSKNEAETEYNNYNSDFYDENVSQYIKMTKTWWSDLITGDSTIPSQTKASKAWRSMQKWAIRKSKKRRYQQSSQKQSPFSSPSHQQDECIFASGPAGCLSSGRYMIQISKSMKHSFEKAIEDFVDVVTEGSEDDFDFIDTTTRVAGKASHYFGNVIVKAMEKNFHRIKLWNKRIRKGFVLMKDHLIELQQVFDNLMEFLFDVPDL